MQAPSVPNKNSGRIFFKVLNGQKLCIDSGSSVDIKSAGLIQDTNSALWELIRDSNGYYSFKNRSTGQYMVNISGQVKTSQSGGENSKWQISTVPSLAVDECKVATKSDGNTVWANGEGTLILGTAKMSLEVTEQADQLFKIVYGDSEDWS